MTSITSALYIHGVNGSPVTSGGTRLLMELRTAMLNYRMLPVGQVLFYNVDEVFEGEELKDEKYKERVERLFKTLEKYAEVLKPIRDEVREKLREEHL